ncbi:MAG: hypothetical protein KDI36_19050, partial [Pseudomonadales bacterium]|nr:hypothetical protein [Pseudomonadales bacterium]
MAHHIPTRSVLILLLAGWLSACDQPVAPSVPGYQPDNVQVAASFSALQNLFSRAGEAAQTETAALHASITEFLAEPDETTQAAMQQAWIRAHLAYIALNSIVPSDEGHSAHVAADQWPVAPAYLDSTAEYPDSGIVNDITVDITASSLREQHGFTDPMEGAIGFHPLEHLIFSKTLNDTANAGMHGRILGLSTVLAAWHGVALVAAFRFNGYERPWLMTLLVAVGAAIWFLLAQIDPFFYFLLSGLFPFVYIFLPLPWAIGMTLVINALAAIDNTGGGDRLLDLYNPALWYWLGFSVVAILMGAWIYAIIRQSMQRRVLIEQLQAAQAQLAAAERREGMLQERERLARDIHDTLAQGFTSIVMHLEAAEQALPGDLATLRHHLDTARDTAR